MSSYRHPVGSRLACGECGASYIVMAWKSNAEVRCGNDDLMPAGGGPVSVQADDGAPLGTQLGKKYVNEIGDIELLVVKAGVGILSCANVPNGHEGTDSVAIVGLMSRARTRPAQIH